MKLFEQVKKDRTKARLAKDSVTSSILTTLVGELESASKRSGAEVSDDNVVQVCKKFIESNEVTIQFSVSDESVNELKSENNSLMKYIPAQMTEIELRNLISTLGTTNVGEIMKNLKLNHNGTYDGALASKIAKSIVS